jgi:membrane protein YdbS with pleckstrin-like domain
MDMSRRDMWRDDEERVISITPVSRGVVRPTLITITTAALIISSASRYELLHRLEDILVVLLVVPLVVVTITRVWRWRSHKVHVTSERVIVEGGVIHHHQLSVEMRDVLATRVEQRVSERLTKRGCVYLDTVAGAVSLGLVRHPSALSRIIDTERSAAARSSVRLDTVYTYEEPDPYELRVRPDEWQRRRYE